jgi:hypothetical protein
MQAGYFAGWGKGGITAQQHDFRKLAASSLTGKIAAAKPAVSRVSPE